MVIDKDGYRLNVGIILANKVGKLFLGKRVGHDSWQFPQGGVGENESAEEAMFRELNEEIGLEPGDVKIIAETRGWLRYRLPKQFQRPHSRPLVIGQKQKWFLLRFQNSEQKIRLDLSESPEFDSWCWVEYSTPAEKVIYFKRQVYRQALKEFQSRLFPPRKHHKRH